MRGRPARSRNRPGSNVRPVAKERKFSKRPRFGHVELMTRQEAAKQLP